MSQIENKILPFLEKEIKGNDPILLAFSGGPDSTFLWQVLSVFCMQKAIPLILIHVDHGWREESAQQALWLQQQFGRQGQTFFIERIDLDRNSSNLEQISRQKRWKVFQNIYRREKAQALFLGHHADDQAETVLKRLFEGASLRACAGMQRKDFLLGMHVLRPLLPFSKKQILDAMGKQPYLTDPTNRDLAFLRARMREEIVPFLEEKFGKKVTHPLTAFAQELSDLYHIAQEALAPLWEMAKKGAFGVIFPKKIIIDHPFYALAFVRKAFLFLGQMPSRAFIEEALHLAKEGLAGKKKECGDLDWIIGKNEIFILWRRWDWKQVKFVPKEGYWAISDDPCLVDHFRKIKIPLEAARRFPHFFCHKTGKVFTFFELLERKDERLSWIVFTPILPSGKISVESEF